MKRPSTDFTVKDLSGQTKVEVTERVIAPLYLAASSFDKGPEELVTVKGSNFYKLFGSEMSFARHGQPAIQAANAINNGAALLIKRIVADDAALAHSVVVADVTRGEAVQKTDESGKLLYIVDEDSSVYSTESSGTKEVQKKDKSGNPLYSDGKGGETTDATRTDEEGGGGQIDNDPIMETVVVEYQPAMIASNRAIITYRTVELKAKKETKSVIKNGETVKVETGKLLLVEGDEETETAPIKTPAQLIELAAGLYKEEGDKTTIPLFVIADNGRGVSNKRYNISIDYTTSKVAGFPLYSITYLGTKNFDRETFRFSTDSEKIYLGNNLSLTSALKSATQIKGGEVTVSYTDEGEVTHTVTGLTRLIEAVSEITEVTTTELAKDDVLFGKTLKTSSLDYVEVDTDKGVDLTAITGLALAGGSNGEFGNAPFAGTNIPADDSAYTKAMVDFFKGEATTPDGKPIDEIFDVDMYKIYAVFDANYPMPVKREIQKLGEFRGDYFFFRDLTTDASNFSDMVTIFKDYEYVDEAQEIDYKAYSKYAATYGQAYNIIDPFTLKEVYVTICYSLAGLGAQYLLDNYNSPFCGVSNGITIPEVVEGTVNFLPKIKPNDDQKTTMIENRINFGSYINGVFTLETQITSQETETRCLHINNVLSVLNLIRDIRTACPVLRYATMVKQTGLKRYASDVQKIINTHSEDFATCEFEWLADDIQLANNIFDATVTVSFADYVQGENFTICTVD